jgi:hypothetical protein
VGKKGILTARLQGAYVRPEYIATLGYIYPSALTSTITVRARTNMLLQHTHTTHSHPLTPCTTSERITFPQQELFIDWHTEAPNAYICRYTQIAASRRRRENKMLAFFGFLSLHCIYCSCTMGAADATSLIPQLTSLAVHPLP